MSTGAELDLRAAPPPPEWGVKIDEVALAALAERWRQEPIVLPDWNYHGLPRGASGRVWFDYCGYAVSVLACLWPPEGAALWQVEHGGEWLADAPALFACFTRMLAGGALPARPGRLVDLFRGRGVLQLREERVERLEAISEALARRFGGSFENVVLASRFDVPALARLLARDIPGYGDGSVTPFGVARFDKLAYLAAAMMARHGGRPFSGLERLPVYPDYMVPRVLRHFGVLRYAPELAAAIDRRDLLAAHSPAEVAIRWATVHAAGRLLDALRARGNAVVMPALDYRLWWLGVLGPDAPAMGEHHRTLTLAY